MSMARIILHREAQAISDAIIRANKQGEEHTSLALGALATELHEIKQRDAVLREGKRSGFIERNFYTEILNRVEASHAVV